jgi:hypothetical protein
MPCIAIFAMSPGGNYAPLLPAKHLLCARGAETGVHVREKPEDFRNGGIRKKAARHHVGAVISSWREIVVDKPKNGITK